MTLDPAEGAPRASRYGDEYFAPGHKIAGKYVIEKVLGEGATSIVYVARRDGPQAASVTSPAASETLDEDTDPPDAPSLVALKIIHANLCKDPQIVGRFHREAAILQRLDGPHVLRVYEALQDDGMLVLVLEYLASTPLEARLCQPEPLSVATAIEITLQICAGLAAAHAAGVVHRDLKPANVLVATDGASDSVFVKVADFGLAKVVQGDKMVTGLTEQDMIFGTPEYMAPEQARGDDVDARADLYAAGCMLYEMLTGDVPFHGSSPMVTMTAHLTQSVVPPRQKRPDGAISPAIEAVLMRSLAKDPADRHSSARAFAEALLGAGPGARVIRAAGQADALGDTDLNIATTLTHSPTLPAQAPALPLEDRAPVAAAQAFPSPATPSETGSITAIVPLSRAAPWLWVTIALIAAIAGIAIGIAIGAR